MFTCYEKGTHTHTQTKRNPAAPGGGAHALSRVIQLSCARPHRIFGAVVAGGDTGWWWLQCRQIIDMSVWAWGWGE